MKFLLGLILGGILTYGSLYGVYLYMKTPQANVNRCINLYMDTAQSIKDEPEILAIMEDGGFSSIEDLVRDRCERFVKNGQRF